MIHLMHPWGLVERLVRSHAILQHFAAHQRFVSLGIGTASPAKFADACSG